MVIITSSSSNQFNLDSIPLPSTPPPSDYYLNDYVDQQSPPSSPKSNASTYYVGFKNASLRLATTIDTVDSFEVLEQTILKQKRLARSKNSDLRMKILLKRTFDLVCEIMDHENGFDFDNDNESTPQPIVIANAVRNSIGGKVIRRSSYEEDDQDQQEEEEEEEDDSDSDDDDEDSDSSDSESSNSSSSEDEEDEEESILTSRRNVPSSSSYDFSVVIEATSQKNIEDEEIYQSDIVEVNAYDDASYQKEIYLEDDDDTFLYLIDDDDINKTSTTTTAASTMVPISSSSANTSPENSLDSITTSSADQQLVCLNLVSLDYLTDSTSSFYNTANSNNNQTNTFKRRFMDNHDDQTSSFTTKRLKINI